MMLCLLTVWLYITGQGLHPMLLLFDWMWLFITVVWCKVILFPLMKVKVDAYNGALYVSNYFKEILVPLSEIKDVQEDDEFRWHFITIRLKTPTEFGQEIKFLPYAELRWWWNWREHSLVGELKKLAQEQAARVEDTSDNLSHGSFEPTLR
jgi:hypothetical protein